MKNQGKVVLFFPSYNSQEISPPLALVSLAAPLLQEGYEVRIIDQSLEKDYVGTVLREMQGALCLGISIITGSMINGAVEVGKAVKNEHPEIPIVLGGWHPSILPEQTLRASFVDVVALKQGEMTLLDLVHCFQNAALPKNVTGILWKDGAEMRWTGQRQHPRVAELPSRLFPAMLLSITSGIIRPQVFVGLCTAPVMVVPTIAATVQTPRFMVEVWICCQLSRWWTRSPTWSGNSGFNWSESLTIFILLSWTVVSRWQRVSSELE